MFKKLLPVAFAIILLAAEIPVAQAIPARRGGNQLPPQAFRGTCEEPNRRNRGGHGRRSGPTAIEVTFRQEVQNEEGNYVPASTVRSPAKIQGDDVLVRIEVWNRGIYDVGNVVLSHRFIPVPGGPTLSGYGSVEGASFGQRNNDFLIINIASGEKATVTMRLLLTGELPGFDISQSVFTLRDFTVLEQGRQHPQRTPESLRGRSRQNVERFGIGTTSVSCFIGASDRRLPPVSEPALSIQKIANPRSARPGDIIRYTITVRNRVERTFRDIKIDDRFNPLELIVINGGGGTETRSGLMWMIDRLRGGERIVFTYTARLAENLRKGQRVPNTAIILSDELVDVPAGLLQSSVEVLVTDSIVIPQTGIEMLQFFALALQILLGVLIAVGLFGVGMWVVLRRV